MDPKTRCRILPLLLALLAGTASGGVAVVPTTTLVHLDPEDPETFYGFFAALPGSVRRVGETLRFSPILGDAPSDARTYFLQDWATYLGADRDEDGDGQPDPVAVPNLVRLIGEVDPATRETCLDGLRPEWTLEVRAPDAVALAATLARRTYRSRPTAVLAAHVANPDEADWENVANAAAYAARTDAPLLYARTGGVDEATRDVLRDLGVTRITVFDAQERLAPRPEGLPPVEDIVRLRSTRSVLERMFEGSSVHQIALMQDGYRSLAASVGAARYGGAVMRIPPGVTRAAVRAYAAIPNELLTRTEKLDKPYNLEDFPVTPTDSDVSREFYHHLEAYGADHPESLERITIYAHGDQFSGVPLTFDRALVGDPTSEHLSGALVGRMPGEPQENLAFICRTALYRALIFSNPRPRHVTMHMVAFEVENTSDENLYRFEDPQGKEHAVNEYFGVHEDGFDDPGVYTTLRDKGYDLDFHNGRNAGPTSHPINEGKPSRGFHQALTEGTSYFYVSCHGGTDAIYTLDVDAGTCEDVEWGSDLWPDPRGRVNVYGDAYTAQDFDEEFENLHSSVNIFNACLVGGGTINHTLLRHGAAASIASYVSVSFDGAGMFNCLFTDRFSTPGVSLGEAFAHATAGTSQIWPAGQTSGDSSLRFILFGDPNMEYIKPGWQPVPPATPDRLPERP